MIAVTPNFHFRGNAKQAIELYQKALGARVEVLMCNSDANPGDYQVQDESQKDLVYHAILYIGHQRIMLTDTTDDALPAGNSLSLVLTFASKEEVVSAYNAVKDGATVIHPVQSTTYSSCFVSLIDKYGMRWELMTEQTER